jgi:hypothetical protein
MTLADDNLQTATDARPTIALRKGAQRRVLAGHPWIYSNEIEMTPAAKALPAGSLVRVKAQDGRPVGTALFNPHSLIAGRLLAADPEIAVDADFLARRLERALALRERLYDKPFYRLVHAEADGLPGVVLDRFGDNLVLQTNSAGMERLLDPLIEAIGPFSIRGRCCCAMTARPASSKGSRAMCAWSPARSRDPCRSKRTACASWPIPAKGRRPAGFSISGRTAPASRPWRRTCVSSTFTAIAAASRSPQPWRVPTK